MTAALIAIGLLILLSALFSGSETALTAASRPLMHEMEREGNARARLVNQLLTSRERLIGTILLGNNLVNILASAIATSVFIDLFGEAGVVYATLAMTLIVLIFAEILPKTYALTHTNAMALAVAPVMKALTWLFSPITKVIQGVVQVVLRIFRAGSTREATSASALAELRGAIEMHAGGPQGIQDPTVIHERAMLRSILDLGDVDIGDIMTHRSNMISIDAELPASVIVEQVLASPYTRLPLWRERPDNVVGVLHVKALLRAVQAHTGDLDSLNVISLAAPAWFVPDTTSLLHQLQAFRQRREHFCLVVDEYGSLQGLATLEDILEEIVGDISDEHDITVPGVRATGDETWLVNGEVTIRDLNREFEWDLPDEDAATIAGLVIRESRTIPQMGQVFRFHGFTFEVVKRVRNRLAQIKVARDRTSESKDPEGDTTEN